MFCVESNPQLNQESFFFSENAEYPYFTRTVNNNGILGYVEYLDKEHLIKGDSIAVGMLGMQFFYMGHDFYAGQFTKTIFAKGFTLNSQLGLFFISLFNQYQEELKSVLVRDFEEKFLSLEIELPIRCNQIDSDYIEKYVNGLIVDNIFLINSFLDTHSLTDCTLTATEEAALQQLLRDEVTWKPVPMNTVFTPLKASYQRKGTRRQDHVSRIRTKEFCLPVICAKRGNNGIMKFGRREDFTAHSNVLSIIYNGAIAAGLVYAHEEDVGIFTDSYLIKWKDEDIPFDVNLFLKTAIQKKIYPIYSREQKATWQNRVENEEIYLPTDSNGEIDVEFMQTIVHAEKKMAVRKVIAYKNDIVKEVTANRAQAIKPHCTTIPLHPSLTYNPVEFEPMMAAEDIFIEGSVPVDLPKTERSQLLDEKLSLVLMYVIGPKARKKTEVVGKIALGIKEEFLSKEQVAAYKSIKYLMFHYWSNPRAYLLTKEPTLVNKDSVPSDYLLIMEKDAVKFLLLDYNPRQAADLDNLNILKTQRRGEIRYLPFVTTLESIKNE